MTDSILSSQGSLEARAEQLLKDITPGEWFISEQDGSIVADGGAVEVAEVADARNDQFIAAAPQLVRDLLAALRDSQQRNEEWAKQHAAALQLHIEAEAELDSTRAQLKAAESACDRLRQQISEGEALIAKWRAERRRVADVGLANAGKKRGYEAAGICAAYETCADELEAALPSRDAGRAETRMTTEEAARPSPTEDSGDVQKDTAPAVGHIDPSGDAEV